MLTIVFLLSFGGALSQQGVPPPFDASRQAWDLPLVAVRADSVSAADWFGGPSWLREGVAFRTAGTPGFVECQVLDEDDFEVNDLRFRFDRTTASVQVACASDVMLGPLQDVGGLAALVTNGIDTVLEFELHALYGGYHIRSLCGAVLLSEAGRALALELAGHTSIEGSSPFHRFVRSTSREDHSEAHGYVDEFGRKQGVWVVREPTGRRLEVSWRNGMPHGNVLGWDEKGRLRSLRGYRAGLQEGESRDWNEAGMLRSFETFVRDVSNGRRVVFHPSGAKEREMRLVNGRVVGGIERWTESGARIADEEDPLSTIFGAHAEAADADRARYLSRFDALRTRPEF